MQSQQSQSEAHCLYREISQPTAVLHSLRCSFLSPFAQNLIVIKAGVLEVYNIDIEAGKPLSYQTLPTYKDQTNHSNKNNKTTKVGHTNDFNSNTDDFPSLPSSDVLHQSILTNTTCAPILTQHTSAKLYGNVVGIQSIHFDRQHTESLCLLFDDNSISILHWDPVSLCICTVFVHHAELRDMETPHGSKSDTAQNKTITVNNLTALQTQKNSNNNNDPYSNRLNNHRNKSIEDDKNGLQHLQQQQLLPSLLIVDQVNKFVIVCQAGCFLTIYYPNPHCDQLLFSPGRVSTLSPLLTDNLSPPNQTKNNFFYQTNLNRQLHVETPQHCSHLLQSIPKDRLAMAHVTTINLRLWHKNIVWVKDCTVCYPNITRRGTGPVLVCLVNTALTWEGRYSATKNSTALVTISLPIPKLVPKVQNNPTTTSLSTSTNTLTRHDYNPHESNDNDKHFNNTSNNNIFEPIYPNVSMPQSDLPHNTYKLIPLPQPLLGCMLITSSSIMHFNLTTLAFATKLNFFDFLQHSVNPVDGVREETGVVLDRVSIACIYAAIEIEEEVESAPQQTDSGSVLDDIFSPSSNLKKHDNKRSTKRTLYPYREVFSPHYSKDQFLAPFRPQQKSGYTLDSYGQIIMDPFIDPKYFDRTRYVEFLVTAMNGESFVLSLTFPVISRPSSIHLGYLGVLSPVSQFVPIVVGAEVSEMINDGLDNNNAQNNNNSNSRLVGSLLFAASLWGDSKVYQFQREVTMGVSTSYNRDSNTLIHIYNALLEDDEKGYPVFDGNNEEHRALLSAWKRKEQKKKLKRMQSVSNRVIIEECNDDDDQDETEILEAINNLIKKSRQNDDDNDGDDGDDFGVGPALPTNFKPTKQSTPKKEDDVDDGNNNKQEEQNNVEPDPYGTDIFDLSALRELGLKVQQEEDEKVANFEQNLLNRQQQERALAELRRTRGQQNTLDVFGQPQQQPQKQEKGSKKTLDLDNIDDNNNDQTNVMSDGEDNDDDDDDDDEDYEDEITIEQRKRRLVRPIAAPWLVLERDVLFGFGSLSNLTPISTSLVTPHTNSTSNAINAGTLNTNLNIDNGENMDSIPKNALLFTSDKCHDDVISMVATGGYMHDGKIVVYNDCLNPHIISTQKIPVSNEWKKTNQSNMNNAYAANNTTNVKNPDVQDLTPVAPGDVIINIFSFTVRDVQGFIQQTLNLNQNIAATNNKVDKKKSTSDTVPTTLDPNIMFETEPLLSLHQVKQIVRHNLQGKKGCGIENLTERSLPTALTQYQTSLLFHEKLTQASNTILSPHHILASADIDPSSATIIVLTTSNATLFYTVSTQSSIHNNNEPANNNEINPCYSSYNNNNNDINSTINNNTNTLDFISRFQTQISQLEHDHRKTFQSQLDDMNYQWRASHTKHQQEKWDIDPYQSILQHQQDVLLQQQQSYLGVHVQDVTKILHSMGATHLVPIQPFSYQNDNMDSSSMDNNNDNNTNNNNNGSIAMTTLTKPIKVLSHPYVPTRSLKTIIAGPILGLFNAWVQVTPSIINLCSGLDHVLCQIPLSKILYKCGQQWEQQNNKNNDDDSNNNTSVPKTLSKLNPFHTLDTHQITDNDAAPLYNPLPITIITAKIQDPYIILQLSNNYLVLIEFNSNPLIGHWYTTTLLSFASPGTLLLQNNDGIKSNPTNTITSDKITALTTCDIDLFTICPQLRNLLTTSLNRLIVLDEHYSEAEERLCRKDLKGALQSEKNNTQWFKNGQGWFKHDPTTLTVNDQNNNKNVNNTHASDAIDDLDMLLASNQDGLIDLGIDKTFFGTKLNSSVLNATTDKCFVSLPAEFNDNDDMNKKDGNNNAKTDHVESILTSLPSLKLLIVATLSFLYIIDLNTITPSSLFAIHLGALQSSQQQQANSFAGFNQNGYIAVPLYTTTTAGSALHSLHNVTNINLSFPPQNINLHANNNNHSLTSQNQTSQTLSGLNNILVSEATPIKEIVFGKFDPQSTTSPTSNNPHNNHYLCLRDQHNHISIYSFTETVLSYIPRKLLNIVDFIRSKIPIQSPQLSHIITQPLNSNILNNIKNKTTVSKNIPNNTNNKNVNYTIAPHDPAMKMSFLDVMLEYTLFLQTLQTTTAATNPQSTNAVIGRGMLPQWQKGMMNSVDVLTALHKPLDIYSHTFTHIDLAQFTTILTHCLSTLPLMLRLEYTNIEDRLFLRQKEVIDFLPSQLKVDLNRYADILYDLYLKYTSQMQKIKDKRAKRAARNLDDNNSHDFDDKGDGLDYLDNTTTTTSTDHKDGDNNDNNTSMIDDIDADNDVNTPVDIEFTKNDLHNNLPHASLLEMNEFDEMVTFQKTGTIPSEYKLHTESEILSIIHSLLTNYTLYNDTGILEEHHFNTTLDEFHCFESKLTLYNRLISHSTFQKLANQQQAQFYRLFSLDPTPIVTHLNNTTDDAFIHQHNNNNNINNNNNNNMDSNNNNNTLFGTDLKLSDLITTTLPPSLSTLHNRITKFSHDEDGLSLSLSLLSFSPLFSLRQKRKINDLIQTLSTQLQMHSNPTPTSLQQSMNNNTGRNDENDTNKMLPTSLLRAIHKSIVRYDLDHFTRKKHYFSTNIQPFNFTTLSSQTLTPFSHNNHNGIVVMGLLPQILLFNHNTASNTITALPLYFHTPNPSAIPPSYNSMVRDGAKFNQTQLNAQLDSLSQQFPVFSQSKQATYDPSTIQHFFTQPAYLTSCTVLSLPHLQTNMMLFVDINNNITTCQFTPKFPSTIPTSGSTVSFTPTTTTQTHADHGNDDSIGHNTELTLFNWKLNKQLTDAMTNTKLVIYNAATRSLRQQARGYLEYNYISSQQKVLALIHKSAIFTTTIPQVDPSLNESDNNNSHGNPTLTNLVREAKRLGASASCYSVNSVLNGSNQNQNGDNDNVSLTSTRDKHHSSLLSPLPPPPTLPNNDLDALLGDGDDLLSELVGGSNDTTSKSITTTKPSQKRGLDSNIDSSSGLDSLLDDDLLNTDGVNNVKKQKIDSTHQTNNKAQKDTNRLANITPTAPFDYTTTPTTSLFSDVVNAASLTPQQAFVLYNTVNHSRTLSQHYSHAAQSVYLHLTPAFTPHTSTPTLLLSGVLTSLNQRKQALSSPSPSAQPTSYIYTNPSPYGLFRFKQLNKTPTHLIIHPLTYTMCVSTQTIIESGTAEIFEPFMMPVMVNSYQLDFFSLHQGNWLGMYNVPSTNPLPQEFASETKHDETLTALTLLTLYDEQAQNQQQKVLQTATKSKYGVWCKNGDPITPQTHPRCYTTATYLSLATSLRDGPLKTIKSTMILLDLTTRTGFDPHTGKYRKYLKVQRVLEHVERLPIHGLAMLSCDIQKPKSLSFPVSDERIAHINNYANPFNHFHTHIVLACGYKVYIYRLNYEENKLIGEAFFDCSFFISSVYCIKNLIVVNDVLKSVTMLVYDVANRNLALFASDYNVTLPLTTSAPFLAKKNLSLLVFDYDQHISQLEFNMNDENSTKYKRLVTNFKYYLGQNVLSTTSVHVGDVSNKAQLNLLSRLIDVVSKSDVLMTNTDHGVGAGIGAFGGTVFGNNNIVLKENEILTTPTTLTTTVSNFAQTIVPILTQPNMSTALMGNNITQQPFITKNIVTMCDQNNLQKDTPSVELVNFGPPSQPTEAYQQQQQQTQTGANSNVVNPLHLTSTDLLLFPIFEEHYKALKKKQQLLQQQQQQNELLSEVNNDGTGGQIGPNVGNNDDGDDDYLGVIPALAPTTSQQLQNQIDNDVLSPNNAINNAQTNNNNNNPQMDNDIHQKDNRAIKEVVTSGTLTPILTTYGYDLPLTIMYHYSQLLTSITSMGYNYTTRPPVHYNGYFIKQFYPLVHQFIQQYNSFLLLDDGLASYFSLFSQEPFKNNVTNGFLSSFLVQNQQNRSKPTTPTTTSTITNTITTANYATTQHGALMLFVPITHTQQYLLTMLTNIMQQNYPFIGATLPSTYHQARTTATFLNMTNHGSIASIHDQAKGTDQQQQQQQQQQGQNGNREPDTNSTAQQRQHAMIDSSVLQMFLYIQQRQKRVLAKSLATTVQTLLDVVKYLLFASNLHPIA